MLKNKNLLKKCLKIKFYKNKKIKVLQNKTAKRMLKNKIAKKNKIIKNAKSTFHMR